MTDSSGEFAHMGRLPPAKSPTTRWSCVRRVAAGGEEGQKALAELCRLYHPMILAHLLNDPKFRLRRQDAEDLAQDFFLQVVKDGVLAQADPERGRFRTYLKSCLRNFWIKRLQHDLAAKRGGGTRHQVWDELTERDLATAATPGEEAFSRFDIEWGRFVLQLARQQVRDHYASLTQRGLERFEALEALFERDDLEVREQLRQRLSLSENHLNQEIRRFRQRFQFALKNVVTDTLSKEADLEDEMRYLASLLRSGWLKWFAVTEMS